MGFIYKLLTLPKEKRVSIPAKNSAIVGFLIGLSTFVQT
jgi:hypothetical protein